MIELKNTGKVVTLKYNEDQRCQVIKLNKNLHLQPKSTFTIDTQVQVICTDESDECAVIDFLDDDMQMYIISERYSKNMPDTNIEITGYYAGDVERTIGRGTAIACAVCYIQAPERDASITRITRERPIIFEDSTMRIESLVDNDPRNVAVVIEADGTKYMKIDMLEQGNNE